MASFLASTLRKIRKPLSNRRRNRRKRLFEPLENRNLLAVLFADSFESGNSSNDWVGNWVEDGQDDWFRSAQRAKDGSYSAEVDGRANDAVLRLSTPVDLSGSGLVELTFDWLIESGFDGGEHLSLDVSSDGGATWQNDVRRLSGNVDAENTWHSESVDLTPYASSNLVIQFRSTVSRSNEDANVDNVQITGAPTGAPEISISDAVVTEGDTTLKEIDQFVANGSGGLTLPRDTVFGPDGNGDGKDDLYVASADTQQFLRYDGATGAFIDEFISVSGLTANRPRLLVFGPEGDVYALTDNSSDSDDNVLRFNGATGQFVEEFVTPGSGGLDDPSGMLFLENGDLLVSSKNTNSVLRYDGMNGNFLGEFVAAGSGGLTTPRRISLGPDFNNDGVKELYVISNATDQVLRYDGQDGSFIDVYATNPADFKPMALAFSDDGTFYLTIQDESPCCASAIQQHDATTGVLLQVDDPTNGGSITVGEDNLVYQSGNSLGDFVNRLGAASHARFTVSLSSPSAQPVMVEYSTLDGSANAGSDYISSNGMIVFEPGVTSRTIVVPTSDDSDMEGDETFTVALSNATGSVIADAEGVGTIQDDESPQINPNTLYVFDISFKSRRGGKDWRAEFEIRRDSNASGTGDAGDAVAAGVEITVEFAGQTYTGTTDSNGIFRTSWERLGGGNYYANAVDLTLTGYVWNPLDLDLEDDSDGDGLPDEFLAL